jgi:hypothetical protein
MSNGFYFREKGLNVDEFRLSLSVTTPEVRVRYHELR